MRDNQVWMTPDGEPIEGMTPARLISHNVQATPLQISMAGSALARFNDERRLSLAGGGFYAVGGELADGTKFRIVSINNVVKVEIWPKTTAEEEELGVTFWCQPWDADWIDGAYEEVFTIPQWYVIDDADSDDENDSEDFLRDLIRNTFYEPVNGGLYPGNQTWFAPTGHPSSGTVVSWWGQLRRYSNSVLDQTIDSAGTWRRPSNPETVFSGAPMSAQFYAPTGGLAGAVAGHMFHMKGETVLPPGVVATPAAPIIAPQRKLWTNGRVLTTPVGFPVDSACIGYRDGDATVRFVSVQGGSARVLELSADGTVWNVLATLGMSPSAVGMPHPSFTLNVSGAYIPTGAGWVPSVEMNQAFHWNADGNEALAIVRYRVDTTSIAAATAYALLKITVTSGSCTLSLVEYSEAFNTTTAITNSTVSVVSVGGNLTTTTDHDASADQTYTYTGIIAADYIGNTPAILRTHIDVDSLRVERMDNVSDRNTVIYHFTDALGPTSIPLVDETITRSETVTVDATVTTRMSLNGTTVPGTEEVRVSNMTFNSNRDVEYAEEAVLNPAYAGASGSAREYTVGVSEDSISGASGTVWTANGPASIWGISAGDLRGDFVVHSMPIGEATEAQRGDCDSSFTSDDTYSYPTGGGGSASGSMVFSKTLRTDIGRMLHVRRDGSTSERTKLFHPTYLDEFGSGTRETVDESETSSTSTGTYGSGPVWSDFALPPPNLSSVGSGSSTVTYGTRKTSSRNYAGWIYPSGAPFPGSGDIPVTTYVGGGAAGAGAYANTALVGCAITPDLHTQYTGALFVAMAEPSDPLTPVTYSIDEWRHDSDVFIPTYPDQVDPEDDEDTIPFPHRGAFPILLNPIFTGPIP